MNKKYTITDEEVSKFYNEIILPKLKENRQIQIEYETLETLINFFLEKDFNLIQTKNLVIKFKKITSVSFGSTHITFFSNK